MNMKKLVAAAALALMVVGTQAGAETLRVGSETVYPPFEFCAEIGSSGSVFMSKIKGAKIRTFNSAGEAFLELNNKGREAIVNDKPVNEYFLTQKASANLNLREVPGVLKAENYGFAIRKGDDKLRARLDKVLDEIRADGTYDKIYAKWFGGNK